MRKKKSGEETAQQADPRPQSEKSARPGPQPRDAAAPQAGRKKAAPAPDAGEPAEEQTLPQRRPRRPKASATPAAQVESAVQADQAPAQAAPQDTQAESPNQAERRSGRGGSRKGGKAPEALENLEATDDRLAAKPKRGRTPRSAGTPEAPAQPSEPEVARPRRGRPPKARAQAEVQPADNGSEGAPEAPLTLPSEDASSPEPQAPAKAPGRPRRAAKAARTEAPEVAAGASQADGSEQPPKRGRRKAQPAQENVPAPSAPSPQASGDSTPEATEPVLLEVPNRRRGRRPRKAAGEAEAPALEDVPSGVEAVEVAGEASPQAGAPESAGEEQPPVAPDPEAPREEGEAGDASLSAPEDALLIAQLRRLGRPVHVRDLERTFTRQALERLGGWRAIGDQLEALVELGQVIRTRKKTYGLPEAMSLVRGRFQASAAGFGFVIPDSGGDDFYIPPDRTMEAWNGDIVLVRMDGRGDTRDGRGGRRGQRGDGNPRATVVRVVQRAYSQLVGTLEFSHGHPILKPDDHRARHRILLLPEGLEELEAGARVVTELFWPENTGEDEVFGQIMRVLGAEDDPETETEAVIVKYGLRGEFPEEVLAQAAAIPAEIPEAALEGRLDLREFNIFTVDGRDAKDFDDAIHIQPTPDGTFVVGVHIADVSHYVREGTPLDAEAYARATSVYLPGRVLPMLPEHLSNGVCSLVPGQDRLTMTALVELSAEGDILNVQLAPSVIHSKARLTYDEVQAYSEATATLPEEARHLEGDLHLLLKITSKLRQKRLREGSLDFKLREVKVDVGPDGRMELIPIREETARGMIEDLMLLANKVVARYLLERDIPTLFRIHEEPTLQKFQDVSGAIGRLGYAFPGGEPTPQAYQAVLKQVRGTGREGVVNTLLLRSMQQAKYSGENLGHFGLAFDDYLHFTSPIRRYPDLVVHRTLRGVLAGEWKAGNRTVAQFQARLPAMGEHTSERERAAAEAERDLTKYYQCKWAQEHVGESFTGNVSGVVSSGLYVALENGVEGKLHISHLDDDYYVFIEDAQILRGRSGGRNFRLGDSLEVTISAVKPLARQIDFTRADPNDPEFKAGSYEAPQESAGMTEVKVRARRRDDREQERQERLKSLPVSQPKFTLDDQPDIQTSPSVPAGAGPVGAAGGRRPRGAAPGASGGRGPRPEGQGRPRARGEERERTFGGLPVGGGGQGGGGGRSKRVVTLERSRSEHLRPVNITAQRMYFGDWSTDHMPPEEGSGGPRAGRERGYERGERPRGGDGRGTTRGGNDRGTVRALNGSDSGAGRSRGGAPKPGPGAQASAEASASSSAIVGAGAEGAGDEGAKRRRRRRGRRAGE